MSASFIDTVRSSFPTLATTATVFLDNAGGTLPCEPVVRHISAYLRDCPVQLGASYTTSVEAQQRVNAAHRSACELFDPTNSDAIDDQQIVFGTSSTMLFNHLASALAPGLHEGDEVIVTSFDHESNIGCWRRLEKMGIRVLEWHLDSELAANPDDLEQLLTDRTRIVAYSHCSNILGCAIDIRELNRRIHAAGAISVVDGVAYAPHRPLSVTAWDADFYVVSLYKVFGPHVAAMYGKSELLNQVSNLNHFFHDLSEPALRLQPGSYPYELVAATSGVVDYLRLLGGSGSDSLSTAWHAIAQHESALSERLLKFLRTSDNYNVIEAPVNASNRLPVISFVCANKQSAAAPRFFDPQSIALRYGHFYARRLIERLGLSPDDGVIRVSLAHYNTENEMDRLIAGLQEFGELSA